jgi:hypothetical protein
LRLSAKKLINTAKTTQTDQASAILAIVM